MRSKSLLFLFFAVAGVLLSGEVRAVVVVLKSGDEPIVGRILNQSPNQILIRQSLPNGDERERTILAADIEEVIVTVPPKRLAELAHNSPADYRDLAEELHEKQRDPEAREAAIRLYLIAAHLDPDMLGRSALLGLIDLARTESERRKFRAMAYLLDPQHDPDILKRKDVVADATVTTLDDQSRGRMLVALRTLRQGRWDEALVAARQANLRQALAAFEDLLPYQQFEAACNDRRISDSVLKAILTVELSLSPHATDDIEVGVRADDSLSWQESITRDGTSPMPALTLESITEFDPRKCHFRDGQWVFPDDL